MYSSMSFEETLLNHKYECRISSLRRLFTPSGKSKSRSKLSIRSSSLSIADQPTRRADRLDRLCRYCSRSPSVSPSVTSASPARTIVPSVSAAVFFSLYQVWKAFARMLGTWSASSARVAFSSSLMK